ncbi:hypothetical protein QBC42DRAFT_255543 [Cladorrhinum samala]|uniref:Transmembrane protein n=1 Tax=Cladorrhinum samala TaxID=585594 RepID=A0AAV9HDU1_9PEZI|nr:hypothetical protein QBC42DRAFT_255543 [Cladorrhinum samala]
MAPVRVRPPDGTSTYPERLVFILLIIAAIITSVLWPVLTCLFWHKVITKDRPHIKRDACYSPLALVASCILGLLAVPISVVLAVASMIFRIFKCLSCCNNATTCCGRPFSGGLPAEQDLGSGVSGDAPGQHQQIDLPSRPLPVHQPPRTHHQPAPKQPSRQSDAAEQDLAASVRRDQPRDDQNTESPPTYLEAVLQ